MLLTTAAVGEVAVMTGFESLTLIVVACSGS